jgi:hypothetical protein
MTDAKKFESYNEGLHHITITLNEPLNEMPVPVGASVPGIPEPATLTLLGIGLGALLIRSRNNKPI